MDDNRSAPRQGQNGTLLAVIGSTSDQINVTEHDALIWFIDLARPRGKCVRYLSDARPGPGAGLWRTYGCFPPERISPFAIVGLVPGRHGIEVRAVLPGTSDERLYEGSIDQVASDLHRAGQRRGGRGDRQALYWALYDLCNEIRRLQAARGVSA